MVILTTRLPNATSNDQLVSPSNLASQNCGRPHLLGSVILPSEKTLPARLNMEIITTLQTKIAPQVFTPRAVYDGRKNLFAAKELPFGESGMKEVDVLQIGCHACMRLGAH